MLSNFKVTKQSNFINIYFFSSKKSSKQWMQRHVNDHYVKEAVKKGYRSRAAFKLIELQQKYKIIKPNNKVLDLGCAPGGWTQMAVKFSNSTKENINVLGIDLLDMPPVEGSTFYKGDLLDEKTRLFIPEYFNMQPIDVCISDMAPNFSGDIDIDHHNIGVLNQMCLQISEKNLKPGGTLLMKTLQGSLENQQYKYFKSFFKEFQRIKPSSSRSKSSEFYYLGKGFKMSKKYFIKQKFHKKIEEKSEEVVQEEEMSVEEQAQFKKITLEFLRKQVRLGNKLPEEDIQDLEKMEFLQGEFKDWDLLRKGNKQLQAQQVDQDIKSDQEVFSEFKQDYKQVYGEKLSFTKNKNDFFKEIESYEADLQKFMDQEKQIEQQLKDKKGKKKQQKIDQDDSLFLSDDELNPEDDKQTKEELFERYEHLFTNMPKDLDYLDQSQKEEQINKLIQSGGLQSDLDKMFDSQTLDIMKKKALNIENLQELEKLKENDLEGAKKNLSYEEASSFATSEGLTQEQFEAMWSEFQDLKNDTELSKTRSAQEFLDLKQKKTDYRQEDKKMREFEKLFDNKKF